MSRDLLVSRATYGTERSFLLERSQAWAVVVAQLVERSLPTPEIRGSNPNIGKLYLPIVHWNWKDENRENEAGNGPFKKKKFHKFTLSLSRLHLELHGLRQARWEAGQGLQGGLQRVQHDRHGDGSTASSANVGSSTIADNNIGINDHSKVLNVPRSKCISYLAL